MDSTKQYPTGSTGAGMPTVVIVAMTRKLYARAEPLASSSVSSAQFDQLNQAVHETQQAVLCIQAQLALYQQGRALDAQ